MSDLNQFVTKFCQWADADNMRKRSRRQFPSALRKTANDLLPKRDDFATVYTRPFSDSEDLELNFDFGQFWGGKGHDDQFVTGVVLPSWRWSWRRASKNGEIVDVIDFFFHFSSQYIARSKMAAMLGALCVVYDRSCDFRSERLQYFRTTVDDIRATKKKSMETEGMAGLQDPTNQRRRKRRFCAWTQKLNCLDPFVHRAVYQFWRSTKLWNEGFLEESTVALDSVVSTASEFVQNRLGKSQASREHFAYALGLSKRDESAIQHLYELRCDFGAHPSRSKWWDFGEIYNEDIHVLRGTVKRILWHLAETETAHRIVEPEPPRWSEWLVKHGTMLLEAVWFADIRRSIVKYSRV